MPYPHLIIVDPREAEAKIKLVQDYLESLKSPPVHDPDGDRFLEAIKAIEWLERYFKID